MFFSNNPNYDLLTALSMRCDSFNTPIGTSSAKRKRVDSIGYGLPEELCIFPKVQRLLEGADVSEIVILPRESFPPLIFPSPLPSLSKLLSSISSPVHSSSPILSPPISPVLRPSKKHLRKSLFKEENPPYFIVEVLNVLLDSLPSVGVEEFDLNDATKNEETQEASLARASQSIEENKKTVSEDYGEGVSLPVESIENADAAEVEVFAKFGN